MSNGGFKGTSAKPVYLKPNEKVRSIRPDYHTRRQNGKQLAYVVEDKWRQVVILSQKLSLICEHINQLVEDKPDQVSTTGLYQICAVTDGSRTGSFSKHRWKVHRFTLDDVIEAFETLRQERGFQNAVVLGSRETVQTLQCA